VVTEKTNYHSIHFMKSNWWDQLKTQMMRAVLCLAVNEKELGIKHLPQWESAGRF